MFSLYLYPNFLNQFVQGFFYRSKGSNKNWYHFHFSHGPYPCYFPLQVLVFLYFLSFFFCHSTIPWYCNINDFTHLLFLLHNRYVWPSHFDYMVALYVEIPQHFSSVRFLYTAWLMFEPFICSIQFIYF